MILAPTLHSPGGRFLDADARAFAAASGATDVAALSAFAKGVKALGLWNSMVCWPLRSSQNAGSGTTVYSFGGLGTYNGTLVNGPTWGANGIVISGNTQSITATGTPSTARPFSAVTVMSRASENVDFRLREVNSASGRILEFAMVSSLLYANIRTIAAGNIALVALSQFNYITRVLTAATTGTIYVNGSATNTSGSSWDSGAAPTNYVIAAGTNTNPTTGTFTDAFHAAFSATLDSTQETAIRDLYKSTLGQGLSLP